MRSVKLVRSIFGPISPPFFVLCLPSFQRGMLLGVAAVWISILSPSASGQAIAFDPIVGAAPTGQTMTVTPAVSADRRYVRLSVNAYFNVVNGFSSFTTPLGAVGGGLGGGQGAGATGGIGGVGGGLGSGDVSFNAGMNGVIGPTGLDRGMGVGQLGFVDHMGQLTAGALPSVGAGYSLGGRLDSGFSSANEPFGLGSHGANSFEFAYPPEALASPAHSSRGKGVSVAGKHVSSLGHAARKTAHRRQTARSARSPKAKETNDEEPVIKPKPKTPR